MNFLVSFNGKKDKPKLFTVNLQAKFENAVMKIVFAILFLILGATAYAQEDAEGGRGIASGWDFGLNFGFYIPPAYHAGFYDGSEENVNKMSYVFGNKYYRDEISRSLNSSDTFFITGMPQNMHYTGAFTIGLYFRRTFDKYFGFSMQFNYSKLHANDLFQIEVDPNTILTEPDLRTFPIWGVEERVNIDLNFSKYFHTKSKISLPFVEAGFNINSSTVKENMIQINDLKYSLVDVYLNGSGYVPNLSQTTYTVHQGGIGWGINAGGGLRLIFNEAVSVDPGVTFYYQKVALENYEKFKPGVVIYVRLSLSGFFAAASE